MRPCSPTVYQFVFPLLRVEPIAAITAKRITSRFQGFEMTRTTARSLIVYIQDEGFVDVDTDPDHLTASQ